MTTQQCQVYDGNALRTCEVPEGWEPFAYVTVAASNIALRRCAAY